MVWKIRFVGSKDACMRAKLGKRDVVWTRKVGMKNKVCGPSWEWTWVDGVWHALEKMIWKIRFVGPAHATFRGQTLFFIPWAQLILCHMQAWSNLIFHTSHRAHTTLLIQMQVYLRAHEPYFSYHFFERMPYPINSGSFSCKPYFSYQLFEFIPRPVDPALLSYKHLSSPQTLFFILSFRAHTTSRWLSFILMQTSFGPTNLIFSCYVPSTQVCSHASVHWTLIIPSIVPSLFDFISSIRSDSSNYIH